MGEVEGGTGLLVGGGHALGRSFVLPKGQAGASRAGTGRPGLTVAGAGKKPYTHPLTFSLTLGRQLGFLCH